MIESTENSFLTYDNIIDSFRIEEDTTFKEHFIEFIHVQLEGNICGNYTKDIKHDIFGNVENLYTLYKYFYEFKNTYKLTDKECNKAEKCVHLYNDCIKDCPYEKDSDYCDGLESFREHYNEYMKAVVCPPNIIKILVSYKSLDISTIILISVIFILVIPFICFILCTFTKKFHLKFTSVKSSLCTPLRSKNKYSKSINEEKNELIHLSQTTKKNSKRKKYNVAYHSEEYT
ncbi:PIR Superfamily Protein [Plasmodium ovale wallikeri]|uniref:PIR Superfamily Protein n=1 Tax=Plasmodium ovale wallikeri TaxID=864142 RepID=A0A1A9AKE3_PLAOA|nr:PIR Superfamily Protein [Plasmodium ovale wallikeri]SBT56664.1 PIR Superfamily Protein [Plasmodium ovale wallikeri]